MAATGYTPIYLYYSSTATNAPVAGNLGYGELAINITDKNLFFKDNANAVNTVPIRQSSASSNGWLSSTDWSTFNGKQAALGYTPVNIAGDTMSGSLTAPSFIPSSSTAPTNGLFLPAANIVGLASNSTEFLRANSSQNVMIGGVTDLGKTAIYYTSTAPSLSSNSGVGLCLRGNTTVRTNFGTESASPYASWIQSTDGAGSAFGLKLQPLGGDVTIGAGNLVIGTSGKGIDFSATAGTGTSELLADYEEGTWDPAFAPTSGAFGTVTYAFKNATYTKVGNTVRVNCAMRTTAFDVGTGTGTVVISGLPYTSGSTANAGASIGYSVNFTTNQPSSGIIAASSTSIGLYYRATANGISSGLPVSDLQNGSNLNYIVLTAVYNV